MLKFSRGIDSSRRMMPSPRPRSTMMLPYSTRLTDAVDDLADAVLELFVLALALGLAHLLRDDLLGRSGRRCGRGRPAAPRRLFPLP
jgi:hypothetical protein